jgi:hypothetical protein
MWDGRSQEVMGRAVAEVIDANVSCISVSMSGMTMIDEWGISAIRVGLRRLTSARVEFRPITATAMTSVRNASPGLRDPTRP